MKDLVGTTIAASENERPNRGAASHLPAVILGAVVFVFIVLSTVIAFRTPAWESADEPGHVQNIETLVAGHWYRMRSNVGTEAHQPPLYYLVLAGWQHLIGKPARPVNPGRASVGPSTLRGIFLHHSPADHRFLLWLRLPNLFLGVGTILLTALAMRQVASDPYTPVVAAAVVA